MGRASRLAVGGPGNSRLLGTGRRVSTGAVGLRIFRVIPHAIVLYFIGIAWFVTTVIAWFAVLFTGAYPQGPYQFAVGYLRSSLRVEPYLLLLHDEYPPFSFEA
ncbi:MAG: DUF4389 domain-containing protein [Casimicrobiaceae bacterium]